MDRVVGEQHNSAMTERGDRTFQRIVDAALALAQQRGLEGISFALVARAAGIAKSSMLNHAADKEQLQLAVVEEAVLRFRSTVVYPALQLTGRARVRALLVGCAEEAARELPAGHAFLTTQVYGVGAGDHRRRLRERLAAHRHSWRVELRAALVGSGADDVDVEAVDVLLAGLIGATRLEHQLRGAASARARALAGVDALLHQVLPSAAVGAERAA